jgi:hypothetical protein
MFPLASLDANSGAVASFNFTNIPQTFNHLRIHAYVRATSSQTTPYDLVCTVNGSNAANYAYTVVRGDGANTSQTNATSDTTLRFSQVVTTGTMTANVFGGAIIDILDYTNTNKSKTAKCWAGFDNNGGSSPTAGWATMSGSIWTPTTAITRLEFATFGNFAQYSRIDIYGVSTSFATGA